MKKLYYVKPTSEVVKLDVTGSIAENILPIGSKFVDSGDIEAKGFDGDGDWWCSDQIKNYEDLWYSREF